MIPISQQILALFILAIPIASIAWTVTHEEIFREPRDWCAAKSQKCRTLLERKIFYIMTCEYCFSHYVTIAFLLLTRYKRPRVPDFRILAGLGGEPVHGHLRQAAPGDQTRTGGNRRSPARQRTKNSGENGKDLETHQKYQTIQN